MVSERLDSRDSNDKSKFAPRDGGDAGKVADGSGAGASAEPTPGVTKEVIRSETIIREVGGGLGDDDLNKAMAPLQKQSTQNMRLLGGLQDKVDEIDAKLNDHDNRIVKLENKTENHDHQHK